jgi:short-subunit dehydrogenase
MKYIWLIGASTGIGEALAGQLAKQDTTIFISARNEVKLSAMAKASSHDLVPVAVDICDDWSVVAAVNLIKKHTDRLDQVIINAGTCEYIDSDEIDIGVVRDVMETNFFGAMNVVNAVLPFLREYNRQRANELLNWSSSEVLADPQLVFLSSSVTYQALPRAGAYGASKAALRYFAESLNIDLQKEDIDVRVVSPGFVETPLTDKNDFPMPFKISAQQAAIEIDKGLKSKVFDISFPKRFTRSLKLISFLPDRLRFKLVGRTSRHNEQEHEAQLP